MVLCMFVAAFNIGALAQTDTPKSDELPPFQSLLSSLEAELDSLKTSEAKFDELYQGHLTKLELEARKTGDLDLVLLVQDELKTFKEDKKRNYEALPELQKLRKVYESGLTETRARTQEKRNQLLGAYHEKLESLKRSRTKAGEIEAALSIDKEQKRVLGLIAASVENSAGGRGPEVPGSWTWKTLEDITLKGQPVIQPKEDGWWRLEKGAGINTFVMTSMPFSPPFAFSVTLIPETEAEVRFGSAKGFLVNFNGGGGNEALVLWAPNSPAEVFDGKGELKKGEAHDIEIRILEDRMEVRVDKRVRGKIKGDFSNYSEHIGLSPFRECPIRVRDMKVVPLEEDE